MITIVMQAFDIPVNTYVHLPTSEGGYLCVKPDIYDIGGHRLDIQVPYSELRFVVGGGNVHVIESDLKLEVRFDQVSAAMGFLKKLSEDKNEH